MTKQHDSKELLRGLQAMNVHLQQSRRICIEYKVDDPVVLAEVAQTWFNWYGKVLIPAVFPHASDFMKRNDLKICTSLTLQLEPREVSKEACEEALITMFHEADRYFQAADFPHDRASLNRNMARFYLNSSSDKDRINVGLAHVKIAEDIATRRALKPKDTLARRFVYRCRAQPQGDQAAADKVALSVAADALAPGQLRAMGGLAVALQWALLPAAYLDAAFSEERLLPLPWLPKDAEFQEACVFGKDVHHLLRCFFESEEAQSFKRKVEEKISGEVLDEVFEKWFQELVPLAQRWRESAAFEGKVPATPSELTEAEYREVLTLLRAAERSGRWPACSKNREKVIKSSEQGVDLCVTRDVT
ncbi:unnamed protein product, partial [Effrenium voratum]